MSEPNNTRDLLHKLVAPAAVLMLGAGALAGLAALTGLALPLIIAGVLAVLIYLYAPRAPGR
jgi:hypothetical protein